MAQAKEPGSLWSQVFVEILRIEMSRLNLKTFTELAELWGIEDGLFSRMRNDKQDSHRADTFMTIDKALRCRPGWTQVLWAHCHPGGGNQPDKDAINSWLAIAGYEQRNGVLHRSHTAFGEAIAPAPIAQGTVEVSRRLPVLSIPVISESSAGTPQEFLDAYPVGEAKEWIACPDVAINDRHAFALEIEGDSMEPEFRAGDDVVVAPYRDVRPGDYVVFKTKDGDVGMKRFSRKGDTLVFTPLNSKYEPQIYPAEDIEWVYRVIWSGRKR